MLKMAIRLKEQEILDEAERLLSETLRDVPFLKSTRGRRGAKLGRSQVDLLMTVRVGRAERRLVCEVKATGQPRVARQACLNLRTLVSTNANDYPVFIAPYLSEDAAGICDE